MRKLNSALRARRVILAIGTLISLLLIAPGIFFAAGAFQFIERMWEFSPYDAFLGAWRDHPVAASLYVAGIFVLLLGWIAMTIAAVVIRAPTLHCLWLRRFHTEAPPRYPTSRLLSQASAAGVHAWTLRDSKVRLSHEAIVAAFFEGALGGAKVWIMLVGGCLLVWANAFAAMLFKDSIEGPVYDARALGWGVTGAVFILAAVFLALLGLLRSLQALRPAVTANDLSRLVNDRWGQLKWGAVAGGITIIGTSDTHWKDAVRRILARTKLILLDVTDISANIEYELGAIRELNRTSSVVLMAASKDGEVRLDLGTETILVASFGADWLSRAPLFLYDPILPAGKLPRSERDRLLNFLDSVEESSQRESAMLRSKTAIVSRPRGLPVKQA